MLIMPSLQEILGFRSLLLSDFFESIPYQRLKSDNKGERYAPTAPIFLSMTPINVFIMGEQRANGFRTLPLL